MKFEMTEIKEIEMIEYEGIVYDLEVENDSSYNIDGIIVHNSTMVMAGSLFAGYEQSSGNIIEIDDTEYKEYYGSASKHNKEELKNIEGKKILIKYKGDMSRLLKELKEDLQSSISYCGVKRVKELKGKEYYII